MASRRGEKRRLRYRACLGKKKYPSFDEAARDANSMFLKLGEQTVPYKCVNCTGWHVGHRVLHPGVVQQRIVAKQKSAAKAARKKEKEGVDCQSSESGSTQIPPENPLT